MVPAKTIIAEGHLRGLDSSKLRKIQLVIANALSPNVRASPIYPRDRNRPGYIFFVTVWECNNEQFEPQVIQKPLSWVQEA